MTQTLHAQKSLYDIFYFIKKIMIRFYCILLFCFLLNACQDTTREAAQPLTNNQLQLLQQNQHLASCSLNKGRYDKTLFVFYMKTCPYCIKQENILKQIKNINVCTLLLEPFKKDESINATKRRELARTLDITAVPTFILPDGKRLTGKQSLTNLMHHF